MPPQEPQYLLVDSNENTLGAAYINNNDELVLYHDASGNEVFLTNAGLEDSAGDTFITGVSIEDDGTAVIDVSGIDFGTNLDVTDNGDGTVTVDASGGSGSSFDVSDSGTVVVSDPTDLNFSSIGVVDDGDGTVTIGDTIDMGTI